MATLAEIASDHLLLTAAAGYLLGSIPFGLLLTRLTGRGELRKIGSGNIGATNVLRSGSKLLALLTLLLDAGKGALAVGIGLEFGFPAAMIAGGGAVLGHLFPPWLGFRGGKGVATTLGVLLTLAWPVGLIACIVWLLVAALFRYSSLAALIAIGTAPLAAVFFGDIAFTAFTILIAGIVLLRHHANVRRLIRGEESRIGRSTDAKG
ncbi:MAG: glycerol-3-phosphate 1-O-acyltransferase PlsY [Alphaproteobacteria bacterium]|nr:glycerol-3-phosphate 1-O-acyltransferase PlsY [Alphaproteobacteria bacterium]